MLQNCCFCIDLRTATLILAICGTLSHFYSAIRLIDIPNVENDWVMSAISIYLWVAGFACLAGFVGVLRSNVAHLRIFMIYYWVDLALNFFSSVVFAVVAFSISKDVCSEVVNAPEQQDLDMQSCLDIYIATCSGVVIGMGFSLLLKLHYSLAIHAYYLTVKHQMQQRISLPENTFIPVAPFSASYIAVPLSEPQVHPEDSDDEEAGSLPPAYSPAPSYPGASAFEGIKQGGVKI